MSHKTHSEKKKYNHSFIHSHITSLRFASHHISHNVFVVCVLAGLFSINVININLCLTTIVPIYKMMMIISSIIITHSSMYSFILSIAMQMYDRSIVDAVRMYTISIDSVYVCVCTFWFLLFCWRFFSFLFFANTFSMSMCV